ncbi:MAG: MFS transporter [Candidatus Bathyarchaeota archaeon]|nr:MFS transporter [Candidatus Bathyarchaeota archaeon]
MVSSVRGQSAEDIEGLSPRNVLFIVTLSHTMQHIFVGSSILFPLIISELNIDYTEFGLAVAIAASIGGLSQIVFSIASRKIARYLLLGVGNMLLSTGVFITGLSRKLLDFIVARLLSGIGAAPQHPMGTAIVSEKFDSESIGRALGFHYGVAYIGNIIGPILMTASAMALGWRGTFLVFSIPILLVGFIIVWYLGRDPGISRGGTDAYAIGCLKSDLSKILKTKGIIAVIASQIVTSGGVDVGMLTTYIPIFLADFIGIDVYERSLVYAIGLLGGSIGPLILGRCGDKAGYIKTTVASAVAASILAYSMALHRSSSILLILHIFLLMFTGFSLPTLLQSYLVRSVHGYDRDLVVGLFFTVNFISNSIWTGVIGFLLDTYLSFDPAFILMGSLGLIGALILLGISRYKVKSS